MKMPNLWAARFLCVLAVVLLGACGGSGGGSSPGAVGSIDPGAGFNKARGLNGFVHNIAAALDGSGDVYVGGDFTTYNDNAVGHLMRLNSDGTVDPDFDIGTGFTNDVTSIAPALDGSGDVYAVGLFQSFNGSPASRIVRLNGDGTRDSGFDIGTGFNTSVDHVAPALDGSGDVYVGGNFTAYQGTPANRLVRLNSDGSIDAAFDTGTGFDARVETIALDGNGDVYVGGSFADYDGTPVNRLVRLNDDGTVDSGFDIGAGFSIPGYSVHSIALAPDGSGDVYVGGLFGGYKGVPVSALVRLNSDGEIDTAFDTGAGFGSGFTTTVRSIVPALDGSGDLYVGGQFNAYNGSAVNRLVRLKNDATLAVSVVVGAGFNDPVRGIAPMSDGDVYVAGFFTAYNGSDINRLVRLNGDGAVDTGFDTGTGSNGSVQGVASAGDGSGDVYVGGSFNAYNGTAANGLVRLNGDGTVDAGFDTGTGSNGGVQRLASARDGSGDVYVGGLFSAYNGTAAGNLVRLNGDGTVDATFDTDPGFDGTVFSIAPAIDGSGDVYVGGQFTTYDGNVVNRLVRLNSDGTVDTGFITGTGFDDGVETIAPALDGSGDVYVGGWFTTYNGTAFNRLVRLDSDGMVDVGFNIGTGFSGAVRSVAPAVDGSSDIYVGGLFGAYDGTLVQRLTRLNGDGTIDADFDVGAGPESSVEIIAPALDSSGDVFVGGGFTSYQATTTDTLTRLDPDASLD